MSRVINIVLFLVLFAFTVNAQNKKDTTTVKQDDPYKEIYELRKQLENKGKEINNLTEQIEELKTELQDVKDKAKNSAYKKQIDELKSQINSLCADTSRLSAEVDSLTKLYRETLLQKNKEKNKREQELNQRHKADSVKIASLEQELANLQKIKQIYLQQMIANLNSDFLDKPFSEVNSTELNAAEKDFAQFASEDKNIASAAKKLSQMKADYLLYLDGVSAVNSPYNAAVIKKLKDSVYKLWENTSDNPKNKKDEIYKLFWQLNNYESKVPVFKELVNKVDFRISKNEGDEWTYAKTEIENLEKKNQILTSICAIPYLKTLYEDYYKKLEGRYNPNAKQKVSDGDYKAAHDAIMNLKLD